MQGRRGFARPTREEAEGIAVAALAFLAEDGERLGRFLAVTGLGPENLRQAAREPGFLGQVLDHFAADESLLLGFAESIGAPPERVAAAHLMLAGPRHEREDP